jgi:hypothetical protein
MRNAFWIGWALLIPGVAPAQDAPFRRPGGTEPAGVVSYVKVVSDKVPDMSSLEAWKKSFIKESMTDEEKAMAVWKTVRTFQHQDAPPMEYLQQEEVVQDPIKVFNVYGYAFCSVASCEVEALARYVGLQARGRIINLHSVPEVYFGGAWHLLDGSLMCYFPKADGKPASVDEIMAGIREFYDRHPEYKKNEKKLAEFMRGGRWRQGPEVLSRCPSYDENGWLEAATHGWYSTMQEYDGSANGIYEYGYSQGYQVNIQLRPGERLIRSWSNKGLHVNMKGGAAPGCLSLKVGQDSLRYTPKDGDLANGRVGNGVLEYELPPALLKEAAQRGELTVRMPSSYVYLTGRALLKAAGPARVLFSDNQGLDWRELGMLAQAGPQEIDLGPSVLRRYDYQLRFEFKQKGAGLESLRLVHDIQHSQRPLPALGRGSNTLTFSAGPPEGTVSLDGCSSLGHKDRQLVYTDYHPQLEGFEPNLFIGPSGQGKITFPVTVPGDLVRIRVGAHYRARDARDGLDYLVSFDGGKTWKTVDRAAGPTPGNCRYAAFSDVPKGTREALVRYAGTSHNATGLLDFRIDADYREPTGGFRPVKITYRWEENGQPKEDIHVARSPAESYTIACGTTPVMTSITLELAD